jgi:hypothetical protein
MKGTKQIDTFRSLTKDGVFWEGFYLSSRRLDTLVRGAIGWMAVMFSGFCALTLFPFVFSPPAWLS